MMVLRRCILNIKITQDDIDRCILNATNDETTATDTKDGSVTATFLEGKNLHTHAICCRIGSYRYFHLMTRQQTICLIFDINSD